MMKLAQKTLIYAISLAISVSAQPVLAYQSPQVSPSETRVVQSPESREILADGGTRATVVVQVKNDNQQQVPDVQVTLASSRGAMDTIIPAIAYADQSGLATFYITSIHAGTPTFVATVDGHQIANRGSVKFATAVYPEYSGGTAVPTSAPANGHAEIMLRVLVKDVGGVQMVGRFVTVASNRAADHISPSSAVLNRDGVAGFSIASTEAGKPVLDIRADGVQIWHQEFEFTKVPVSVDASRVVSSHTRAVADGTSAVTVTVSVRAQDNAALPGRTVTLESDRGVYDYITPASAQSDQDGNAVFYLRSTQSGSPHLRVMADGVALPVPGLMFLAAPSSDTLAAPSRSSVSPARATTVADGKSAVQIVVVANNNDGLPLTGKQVSLGSNRGSADQITAIVNPTASRPDQPAAAIFYVTSQTSGEAIFRASVDGVGLAPVARVTFTQAPPSAAVAPLIVPANPPDTSVSGPASSMASAPASVPANGETTSLVTVSVHNRFGDQLPDKSVVLASSRSATTDTINPVDYAVTNAQGVAIFRVTSKVPGAATFTAIADGVTVQDEARVLFSVPNLKIVLSPGDVFRAKGHATVYYYGRDGKRYAFPNEAVYFTWYDSFAPVKFVSDTQAVAIPLARNMVHPRPGTKLVQFVGLARDRRSYVIHSAKVYVVEPGGTIRWLVSPEVAESLYGPLWEHLIMPKMESDLPMYERGADVASSLDFNVDGVQTLSPTIDADMGI